MSGGSFNYLSIQLPMKLEELEGAVERMAAAVAAYGFPVATAKSAVVVLQLQATRAAVEQLADLWHAVEWHRSGDDGPAGVRAAAIALGDQLPACLHLKRHYGYDIRGPGEWCEACGERFDVKEAP